MTVKTAPAKHIHKYMRGQMRHVIVWRCALCYHFMPPHMTEMVIGRESLCWGCGQVFRLDESSMEEDMPTCFKCKVGNRELPHIMTTNT